MNQSLALAMARFEAAVALATSFRAGAINALALEHALTAMGFYNVTFEFPVTAQYMGIKYELEQK